MSLGPGNGTNFVIREGLQEGEQIVLNAAAHKAKIDLPPLPKKTLTASIAPTSPLGNSHAGARD